MRYLRLLELTGIIRSNRLIKSSLLKLNLIQVLTFVYKIIIAVYTCPNKIAVSNESFVINTYIYMGEIGGGGNVLEKG